MLNQERETASRQHEEDIHGLKVCDWNIYIFYSLDTLIELNYAGTN